MIDNDGSEKPATLPIEKSKAQKKESYKLWLPVTAIAVVALPLLLLNLSESTLFPLSLKAQDWTGFGSDITEEATTSTEKAPDGKIIKTVVTSKKEDGKTLWDWLSVLGVPLTLALLGAWFQTRQQTQSDKKADLEKEIAETASKEEVIQAYLDKLSDLLIDKNLIAIAAKVQSFEDKSAPKEEVNLLDPLREQKEQLGAAVDVIRARTLAVLRRLKDDPERKTSVMEFLLEAEVIQRLNLSLRDANLRDADLRDADLRGADLRDADLRDADLIGARLIGARLIGAQLISADLRVTKLRDADLRSADLRGAKLIGANLSGADLSGADLRGTDLRGVDLSGADLVSAKLSGADLRGAKLIGANLSGADLSGADLRVAKLSGADLIGAKFIDADLIGADLSSANLSGADLSGAILLRADFRDAEELTKQQLEGENPPLLCNVTLPNEVGVDPNRDCEKLPQALLDKFPKEFENLAKARAFVDEYGVPVALLN